MRRLILFASALIIIGAGCGTPETPEAPSAAPPPPAPAAAAPAKSEPADIRVTDVQGTGNAAGNVTKEGCDGPHVDLKITLQNKGADYPDPAGFDKLKAMIDARQGDFGATPFEDSPLFGVRGEVDLAGKIQQFEVPVLPRDLPDGKLRNGQSMTVKTFVDAPCCDPLPRTMTLTAHTIQSSSFVAPGDGGIKEPYVTDAALKLPDVTPGHGQVFYNKDKHAATAIVEVENLGEAPTAGPIKVQVDLPRIGSGFSAATWEKTYDQTFTGTVTIGPLEGQAVTGEPDLSKVNVGVYTLCPSETYDIIHDANPQNDHVTRDASATQAPPQP